MLLSQKRCKSTYVKITWFIYSIMYIPKWNPQNAIGSYLAPIFGSTDKKTLERIGHQDETEFFVFSIWTNRKRARTQRHHPRVCSREEDGESAWFCCLLRELLNTSSKFLICLFDLLLFSPYKVNYPAKYNSTLIIIYAQTCYSTVES